MEHDFVIDELGINEMLASGEPVEVTLGTDLAVGDTYTYYCSIPGHRESGMEGVLTIVDAAPAAADAPAEEEAPAAGGAAAPAGPVILEASDPFDWSTKELSAAPGQVIQITNTGVMEHDFVIDELGINEMLASGEPVEVTLGTDLTVGDTYTYYCSIPGHRESGMEGVLTIVEASAAAPAEEDAPAAEAEASPAASPAASAVSGTEFEVVTTELIFTPSEIAGPANTDITVTLVNEGLLPHDFAIDDLDIKSDLIATGETTTITINAPAGTYEFYCTEVGHAQAGMVGTLTIA